MLPNVLLSDVAELLIANITAFIARICPCCCFPLMTQMTCQGKTRRERDGVIGDNRPPLITTSGHRPNYTRTNVSHKRPLKGKGKNALAPHLSNEARLRPLVIHALPAGERDGVVLALLRREALEQAVRRPAAHGRSRHRGGGAAGGGCGGGGRGRGGGVGAVGAEFGGVFHGVWFVLWEQVSYVVVW